MINTLKYPKRIRARKEHSCDYCEKKIVIGEEHEISTYASEGMVYDWRVCDRCKPFVDEAFSNDDYSWDDGMNNQEFHDYMWEEHYDNAMEWWRN